MRLPTELVIIVDEFCTSTFIDRTKYIETLIRHDLKRRKLFPESIKKEIKYYKCDIEDMPLR